MFLGFYSHFDLLNLGRSENHENELGILPECYYYVLVYYKTGFEEKN